MKAKLKLAVFFGAGMALFWWHGASAATSVAGTISTDTTWTAADSPYLVGYNAGNGLKVSSPATLTIDPGVVVKFESGAQIWVQSGGKILAEGTAAQHIIFTSLNDDTAGGVLAGSTGSPAAGDWGRVENDDSNSVFKYVELRYSNLGLSIVLASPTVTDSVFRNNNYGMRVQHVSTAITIARNSIYNNGYGIWLDNADGFGAVIGANNNIYSNTFYGVYNNASWNAVAVGVNWWGHAAGPCLPANHPDCGAYGDKVSDGFTFGTHLGAAYSESPAPAATTGGGRNSPSPPPPPKILKFEASPAELIDGLTENVFITWDTWGTDRVEFGAAGYQPELGGIVGGKAVSPKKTATYVLTAYGAGGQTSASVTVTVRPRDPVIIVPGILGSWQDIKQNELVLDPILHKYDGLWEGLRNAGYEEKQTLFAFPYNWRLDNAETAELLGQKIDQVLGICHCKKVDVVAHSMGGLVTRHYIQNINSSTIDQLIFLGTPHLGASKAYLGWEAGEMGPKNSDKILKKIINSEAKDHGYKSIVDYIHENVPSLKQLLPVYTYLSAQSTGKLIKYEECKTGALPCNAFIESLENFDSHKYDSVSLYNIVNDKLDTLRSFIIGPSDEKGKWEHGKPINYDKPDGMIKGVGDGTVPAASAKWRFDKAILLDSEHDDLPYFAQSEVVKILINKDLKKVGKTPVKRWLFVGVHSPVDITVTTPSGKVYGAGEGDDGWAYYSGTEDPEFITIPDPEDGDFTILVTGTGEGGKFGLEASLLADDEQSEVIFEGEIAGGEQQKFILSSAEAGEVKIEAVDLRPPETELILDGEKIGENYAPVLLGVLSAKDDSGGEIETVYSLDDGLTWQKYESELKFATLGEYRLLYKSTDKSGNNELVKIAHFTIVPKPAPPVSPPREEETQEEVIGLPSPGDGEGLGEKSSSTPSTTPSVLGASASPSPGDGEGRERSLAILAALIILSGLGLLTKLIIHRRRSFPPLEGEGRGGVKR